MRTTFLLFVFIVVSFGSAFCQSLPDINGNIFGRWRLIKHTYVMDGKTINVPLDGIYEEYVFYKEGNFSLYSVSLKWAISSLKIGEWTIMNNNIDCYDMKFMSKSLTLDIDLESNPILGLSATELQLSRVIYAEYKGISTFERIE